MKIFRPLMTAIAVSFCLSISAPPTLANDISVHDIRARPSLGAAKNSAAFFVIENKGSKAKKLINVQSDVAKRVELHTHLKENGIFKMRPIESIPVPAHGKAELKPGGHHVMLIGVKSKLKIGDKFMLKLNFSDGKSKVIHVPVLKIGSHGMKHGIKKMDHKKKMPTN